MHITTLISTFVQTFLCLLPIYVFTYLSISSLYLFKYTYNYAFAMLIKIARPKTI